jgi:Cytochrome c3
MRGPAAWALLALCAAAAAGAAPPEESCGTCHPEQRVQHAESVHAAEGVTCTDCHGGDPSTLEVERAHGGEFRPLTDRRQIPGLCARCHADIERMRPYNLPVDQYALFQTSQHGRALARGDLRAAVCSDCHSAHEIRRASDPASRTYRRNLPDTCGRCHGDPQRMAAFGLDAGIIEAYRTGLHGQALLERGNAAAPSCSDCHGVHGAAPPGVGDVDKVCGSCHQQTRRAFLDGPHHQAMEAAGLPQCASCHGDHHVTVAADVPLGDVCAGCHAADSPQVALGGHMQELMDGARQQVDEAERLVRGASRGPIHVEDYLSRLEDARTQLTEAKLLVHTVSLEPVEAVTRRARSIGEEVQRELKERLDRGRPRLVLAVVWFYLLMTLAILLGIRRRIRRRGAGGE